MRQLRRYQAGGPVGGECPESTMNPEMDSMNKTTATQDGDIAYNAAGGTENTACSKCALFDIASRMQQCMQESGQSTGYCQANQFNCEAAGICNKYEEGGPIVDDQMSYDVQAKYTDEPIPPPQQQMPPQQQQMPPQMPPPGMEAPQTGPPAPPPMMRYGGEVPQARYGGATSRYLPRAQAGNSGVTLNLPPSQRRIYDPDTQLTPFVPRDDFGNIKQRDISLNMFDGDPGFTLSDTNKTSDTNRTVDYNQFQIPSGKFQPDYTSYFSNFSNPYLRGLGQIVGAGYSGYSNIKDIVNAQQGGSLPKAQDGVSHMDSVRHQVGKIPQYEEIRGGRYGNPLKPWRHNTELPVGATTQNATDWIMDNVVPQVNKLMPNASAMEKGEVTDFVYNSGFDKKTNTITKDPRGYAIQEYYRKYDPSKLDAPISYEGSGRGWSGRKGLSKAEVDKIYGSTVGTLSENERRVIMNLGRDWYMQGIERGPGSINENLEAYKNTWYGRIGNMNTYEDFNPNWWKKGHPDFRGQYYNHPDKRQYGGSLPRAQTGNYGTSLDWDKVTAYDNPWTAASLRFDNVYNEPEDPESFKDTEGWEKLVEDSYTTKYDRKHYGADEPVKLLEIDDYIKKMYDITRPDYQYPNHPDDGYRTIYDDPGITYDPPRGRIPDDEYRTIDDRPPGMDIYAHESDKSNYFSNFPDQGPPNIDYDASFGEDDSEPDPSLESQYRTIYDRPPGSSNALPFVPRKDFGNFSTRRGKLWDPKQRENTLTRDSSGGVLVPKQRGGGIGNFFDRQTRKTKNWWQEHNPFDDAVYETYTEDFSTPMVSSNTQTPSFNPQENFGDLDLKPTDWSINMFGDGEMGTGIGDYDGSYFDGSRSLLDYKPEDEYRNFGTIHDADPDYVSGKQSRKQRRADKRYMKIMGEGYDGIDPKAEKWYEKKQNNKGKAWDIAGESVIAAEKMIEGFNTIGFALNEDKAKAEIKRKRAGDYAFQEMPGSYQYQPQGYGTNTGLLGRGDVISHWGRYGTEIPRYQAGGNVVDVNDELLRELIAAGADVEIL